MINRTLSFVLDEISELFPVIMLTGMRQVGKSTLLEMKKTGNRKYVSLDNFDDRELAKSNPSLFIQRLGKPVGDGVVICLRNSPLPLSNNIIAVPIFSLA